MTHGPPIMSDIAVIERISRKQRKKQKRKNKRQELAQLRAQTEIFYSKDDENDLKNVEADRQKQHELWVEREKQALTDIAIKKEKAELELKRQQEQEKKIRQEWEEKQQREKDELEKKIKEKEVRDKKVDDLLKEATKNERDTDCIDTWHNPVRISGKEILRECCPFFAKTAACRFGQNCSRAHEYPDTSKVLMFPGMFTNFLLDLGLEDEHDTDIALEYEDSEVRQHFMDFYEDVVPEFRTIGKLLQFKVCCNFEPHLRGNVYVAYENEEAASNAYIKFNGRFYGGKQLSSFFVTIKSWKSAICGLFGRNRCPKGKNCNFLHVFRNPTNEFTYADRDVSPPFSHRRTDRRYNRHQRSRSRNKNNNIYDSKHEHHQRHRHKSNERHAKSRSRERSKSTERYKRHHRCKSSSRERMYQRRKRSQSPLSHRKQKRSSSRNRESRNKYRSKSRSYSPERKHHNNKKNKSHSRSHSKSASPQYERRVTVSKSNISETQLVNRKNTNRKSRSRSSDSHSSSSSSTLSTSPKTRLKTNRTRTDSCSSNSL